MLLRGSRPSTLDRGAPLQVLADLDRVLVEGALELLVEVRVAVVDRVDVGAGDLGAPPRELGALLRAALELFGHAPHRARVVDARAAVREGVLRLPRVVVGAARGQARDALLVGLVLRVIVEDVPAERGAAALLLLLRVVAAARRLGRVEHVGAFRGHAALRELRLARLVARVALPPARLRAVAVLAEAAALDGRGLRVVASARAHLPPQRLESLGGVRRVGVRLVGLVGLVARVRRGLGLGLGLGGGLNGPGLGGGGPGGRRAARDDSDGRDRRVARVDGDARDGVDDVAAGRDAAEDDVLPVQVGRRPQRHEELRAVGVGPRVRHRQHVRSVVLVGEALVGEFLAVDGLAARAVAPREVAALDHEVPDDAVEGRARVRQARAAVPRAERAEILAGARQHVRVQLEGDALRGTPADGHVEPGPSALRRLRHYPLACLLCPGLACGLRTC